MEESEIMGESIEREHGKESMGETAWERARSWERGHGRESMGEKAWEREHGRESMGERT